MRKHFRDVLAVQEVRSVTCFDPDGAVLFEEGVVPAPTLTGSAGAFPLLTAVLVDSPEADLAFSRGRIYARRTPTGSLVVVVAGPGAPLALLRLQVDLTLASLPSKPARRGVFGRFRG